MPAGSEVVAAIVGQEEERHTAAEVGTETAGQEVKERHMAAEADTAIAGHTVPVAGLEAAADILGVDTVLAGPAGDIVPVGLGEGTGQVDLEEGIGLGPGEDTGPAAAALPAGRAGSDIGQAAEEADHSPDNPQVAAADTAAAPVVAPSREVADSSHTPAGPEQAAGRTEVAAGS
jgi:hypothetical protein